MECICKSARTQALIFGADPQGRPTFESSCDRGLLLQVLFTGVFALQAYKSYGVPEKADRFPLFVVMGIGSIAALGMMRLNKPKKKKV